MFQQISKIYKPVISKVKKAGFQLLPVFVLFVSIGQQILNDGSIGG